VTDDATTLIWQGWALRLGAVGSLIGIIVYGAAFMDARYASASDISSLIGTIKDSRIERLEYEIRNCDRRVQRVLMVAEADRTSWDIQDLQDAKSSKEYLLRQLERLQDND
jgi:hypothetical protein